MTAVGDSLPDGAFDRPLPALSPADRWHLDVYGFVVVHDTLSPAECSTLIDALHTLKEELLECPLDPEPHIGTSGGHGPGRGGSFIRPGQRDAPQHFLAHLIEADPAISAYATHPRLVAMCEEYSKHTSNRPLLRAISRPFLTDCV